MIKKFPEWAPAELVGFYSKEQNNRETNFDLELLERLLKSIEMKSVWRAIRKRSNDPSAYVIFYYHVEISSSQLSEWVLTTKAQQKKIFRDIIKTSTKLQTLLKKVPTEYQSHEFLTETFLSNLAEKINDPYDQETLAHNKWYLETESARKTPLISNLAELLLRIGITNWPTLFDLLGQVIKYHALEEMKVIEGISRPNIKDIDIVMFVRRLAYYNKKVRGDYLYNVISTTANVIYRKDIDNNRVRDIIKATDFSVLK